MLYKYDIGANMYSYKQNKYLRYYQQLISSRRLLVRSKSDIVKYERHHILPKSLGGNNTKLNLILLTGREHYIAHLLLVRIVQDEDVYKMINAVRRFKKKCSNAKEYALLRSTMITYSTGKYNASYGKIWIHNAETLEILYVQRADFKTMDKEKFFKGLPYQRGGHRDTTWMNNGSEETCANSKTIEEYLSNGWNIGRLNPMGTAEMQYVSSFRHTAEKDKEHSQKLSGRIAIKNLQTGEVKRVKPDQLQQYLDKGYTTDCIHTTSLSKKFLIDNIIYNSAGEAANQLNLEKAAITYRAKSKLEKWKNWQYLIP